VQQANGGGARAGFRRNVLRVGRDPRNELVLADEQVSRLHAQIRREADGYVLYDLNSKNGTFVNGQQIARCRLRPGDRIRVGATDLVFFE
jgi:pSer/pThr/pTyr-binding forkhead associated (FHA) protein